MSDAVAGSNSQVRPTERKTEAAILPTSDVWKPSFNPWLIAASVMLATFMEVLDTSVANVALPHIAGNLSASTNESTWVLTSYLVSNAIILPATNWLGHYFGRRRFPDRLHRDFHSVVGPLRRGDEPGHAAVSRALLQGAGGGALQPIAQAVLAGEFSR